MLKNWSWAQCDKHVTIWIFVIILNMASVSKPVSFFIFDRISLLLMLINSNFGYYNYFFFIFVIASSRMDAGIQTDKGNVFLFIIVELCLLMIYIIFLFGNQKNTSVKFVIFMPFQCSKTSIIWKSKKYFGKIHYLYAFSML